MNRPEQIPPSDDQGALDSRDRAVDGLLRELKRGGTGTDEEFVQRVLSGLPVPERSGRVEPSAEFAVAAALVGTVLALSVTWPPLFGILSILAMLCAIAGMGIGVARQLAGRQPGRPLTLWSMVLALFVMVQQSTSRSAPYSVSPLEREMIYRRIAGHTLGAYLAARYSGTRVLLILPPPNVWGNGPGNALLDGLMQGLGKGVNIVARTAPVLPNGHNGAGGRPPRVPAERQGRNIVSPSQDWYTAEVLDSLVAPHAGSVDLVVTTIGLPADSQNLTFWRGKSVPQVVLAAGYIRKLREPIIAGKIAAALADNPAARGGGATAPEDLTDAFNRRFLLVTPENCQALAVRFPELFAD